MFSALGSCWVFFFFFAVVNVESVGFKTALPELYPHKQQRRSRAVKGNGRREATKKGEKMDGKKIFKRSEKQEHENAENITKTKIMQDPK